MTRRIRDARDAAGGEGGLYRMLWQIADEFGMEPPGFTTMKRWFYGQFPATDHLATLCVATGLSAEYLLGLSDDPKPGRRRWGLSPAEVRAVLSR